MPYKDPQRQKEYKKLYWIKYSKKNKLKLKKYYIDNIEMISNTRSIYYRKNKEKIKERGKIYRNKNKDILILRKATYFQKNKNRINKQYRDKRKLDIQFKLSCLLRSRLNHALRDNFKSGSAVRDLGCTIPELKTYLENQFKLGMTWDNWTRTGWHIDHKKALANFDLTDRIQLLEAVHYTNLQPMWAIDNIKKSNIPIKEKIYV
jgi:hypothetical protein